MDIIPSELGQTPLFNPRIGEWPEIVTQLHDLYDAQPERVIEISHQFLESTPPITNGQRGVILFSLARAFIASNNLPSAEISLRESYGLRSFMPVADLIAGHIAVALQDHIGAERHFTAALKRAHYSLDVISAQLDNMRILSDQTPHLEEYKRRIASLTKRAEETRRKGSDQHIWPNHIIGMLKKNCPILADYYIATTEQDPARRVMGMNLRGYWHLARGEARNAHDCAVLAARYTPGNIRTKTLAIMTQALRNLDLRDEAEKVESYAASLRMDLHLPLLQKAANRESR